MLHERGLCKVLTRPLIMPRPRVRRAFAGSATSEMPSAAVGLESLPPILQAGTGPSKLIQIKIGVLIEPRE